jgi:electron transfer flavoprotein alpha subunit
MNREAIKIDKTREEGGVLNKEGKVEYRGVWVFADYRNYYKNRVTLELISEGKRLSRERGSDLCVVLFGHNTDEYIKEYMAHGADWILVIDDQRLSQYRSDIYSLLLSQLVMEYRPEILLIGATDFGREVAPRVAKRLRTGLSSGCTKLEIDKENGLLVQSSPMFNGNFMVSVITPERRPQMATIYPGQFRELPHNKDARGRVVFRKIDMEISSEKVRLRSVKREKIENSSLEDAKVVICGGKGIGTKEGFESLKVLASLLGGEVGATRPVVMDGLAGEDQLIGQTGRKLRPKLLITCGTSGAIQYTAGIENAEWIVAINKDPEAAIFGVADIGIVGDANRFVQILIDALQRRKRSKGI